MSERRSDLLNAVSCRQDIIPDQALNQLVELFVPDENLTAAREEAAALEHVSIGEVDLQWVQVLSEGWASPLKGFMREREYLQTLHFACLLDGKSARDGFTALQPASPLLKCFLSKFRFYLSQHLGLYFKPNPILLLFFDSCLFRRR